MSKIRNPLDYHYDRGVWTRAPLQRLNFHTGRHSHHSRLSAFTFSMEPCKSTPIDLLSYLSTSSEPALYLAVPHFPTTDLPHVTFARCDIRLDHASLQMWTAFCTPRLQNFRFQ